MIVFRGCCAGAVTLTLVARGCTRTNKFRKCSRTKKSFKTLYCVKVQGTEEYEQGGLLHLGLLGLRIQNATASREHNHLQKRSLETACFLGPSSLCEVVLFSVNLCQQRCYFL